ncbi:uncharacterized protein LOC62_03G004727 [Vanrija pseudolonga]|uniref:Uncharacterized protein n=1 Tax=Vanrija pseudolonga TaxID=143232 RepID=A0AAF0Y6L9_9TREE|nr:hypothetical protein LOC62_03G004727 [Vanrija pseudolonga]
MESYGLPAVPGNWISPQHHQGFSHAVPDQADLRNQVAQLQAQLLASYNREQQLKDRSTEANNPSHGGHREPTKDAEKPDPSARTIMALEHKVAELEQLAAAESAKRREAESRERGANKSQSLIAKEKHEATRKAEELEKLLHEAQDRAAATERAMQDQARTDRSELERLKSQRAMDANQNRMVKDHLGRVEQHERDRLKDKLKSIQFENNALQKRVDELARENAAMSAVQRSRGPQSAHKMPNGAGSYRHRGPMAAPLSSPEVKVAPPTDPFAQLELLG